MQCLICDGSGYVRCPKCHGSGEQWNTLLKRTEPCTWCAKPNEKTFGRSGHMGVPGTLVCSGCKGTGQIPDRR
jgi:hypothetical protein